MSLTSLVQTRSIENVLKPIATKVSYLMLITKIPVQTHFQTLDEPAHSVKEAIQKLAQNAQRMMTESEDEVFHKEMKPACEQTLLAAQLLLEAVGEMKSTSPPVDCQKMHIAAQKILEGTMKVLLVWDESEVRKIIVAAQWTQDRLKLVQAARSMRALLVCYTGFFESMSLLIQLSNQRQQEMTIEYKKQKLVHCLSTIRECLPQFCQAMQDFVKNPDTEIIKDRKDELANLIFSAIQGIIDAVKKTDNQDDQEEEDEEEEEEEVILSTSTISAETMSEPGSETMATHFKKIQVQLSADQRHILGLDELDQYLDAIIKNSTTIANVSKSHYKETILQLCQEILEIRQVLGNHLEVFQREPTSVDANAIFNRTVDELCLKLQELDKTVANSVADQVAETFVEPSAAINHLVEAAVGGSSSPIDEESSSDSVEGLKKTVEVFRRHSRRLSEVAIHAAQGTLSRKRSKRIKKLTNQLDDLTQKVVSISLEVRKNPQNQEARQQLIELRKEWAEKVKALTAAIDEIVNVEEFTAATEANIVDDMTRCRKAIDQQNWAELVSVVHNIASKARRVSDVAKTRAAGITDLQTKIRVKESVKTLEIGVETMLEMSKRLIDGQDDNETKFVQSLEHVLTCIHNVQETLPETMEPVSMTTSSLASSTTTQHMSGFMPWGHMGVALQEPQSTSTPVSSYNPLLTKVPFQVESSAMPTPPIVSPPPSMIPMTITSVPTSRYYKAPLSPTDQWIISGSPELTTPSSFAPTDPSLSEVDYTVPSMGSFQDKSPETFKPPPSLTQSSRPILKDEDFKNILYPSSLGGLSITNPSLIGAPSWQSEASVNETQKKGEGFVSTADQHLLETYTQPLKQVVSAAGQGNSDQLNSQVIALSQRAHQLTKMAESAAITAHDPNLARVLHKESAMLNYLTPHVIRRAEEMVRGVRDQEGEDKDLDSLSQRWAGHVRTLIEASQKANMPWSQSARRLVKSAKSRKGLDKEISNVSSQTERMVDIAMTTIKAATIEDAIGSTGNLDHEPDPIVQNQIEQVNDHVQNIQTITPTFISTAQKVAKSDSEGRSSEIDQLNFLSHKWATKANVLMRGVDDITIGMSGPADSLLISANSGDPTLLDQQAKSITNLSSSLMTISKDAVQGCTDEEKIKIVLDTAETLQQLSSELVDCAKEIARLSPEERGEEAQQTIVEKAEVLRRDWAAKMHLLTANIDDLTAGVAGPLDRLISVALQASRTEGMAKDHLMEQFEKKEAFISDQLDVVSNKISEVMNKLTSTEPALQNCSRGLAFIQRVTPHVIGAARSLSSDPGSAKLDHFSHLRRQWASKAQSFFANLVSVSEDTNVTDVVTAFEDLLQGYKSTRSTPSTYKTKRRGSYDEEHEDGDREKGGHQSRQRYYSTDDIEPPNRHPPAIPHDEDEDNLSYSLVPSSPDHYFTSGSPQMVLKMPGGLSSQRHISMGTLPTTSGINSEGILESSLNNSIIVAAKSLHDAANVFMEEGNPLVALAKKMSSQMFQMAEFARGRGKIQSMSEMIHTAKDIAANAQQIVRYANLISEQCTDKRTKANLQHCVEMIPTLSQQLSILASVKSSTDDIMADYMLVKNAQNLMNAVIQTIEAAEAAYIKGLKPPETTEETQTAELAMEWKRKLYFHRNLEAINAPLGAKGLRKLKKERYSVGARHDLVALGRY